jgi:hypothetical protein
VLGLELEGLSGKFQAGQQILALQVRELDQQILDRVAPGQVLQHGLYGIPEAPNHRLAVANVRANRNARQQ